MARKSTEAPKISPEVGWKMHSRYGALKDSQGNPLESLEAVHALLMKRDGLTSAEAAVRVFGPFVTDANSELGIKHGAAALRRHLHVVDPTERADAVSAHSGLAHVDRAAQLVPYVPHHHFEKGTPEAFYYALGVMAGEAWSQSDRNLDLNDRLDGYCAEGDFPSIEKAREILGPFAVRHELAHKLWGWGTVGAIATIAQPIEVPASAPNQTLNMPSVVAPENVAAAGDDASPVEGKRYDWSNVKTQAAFMAAWKVAPGKSARAKAAHLATTEKWGNYTAETLRQKHSALKNVGHTKPTSKDAGLTNVWGINQRKSKKAG